MAFGTAFSNTPTGIQAIAAGQSQIQTIDFHPKNRGIITDTLVIKSDATLASDQRKTILISGTGINGVFTGASSLDFGKLRLGSERILNYLITNSGDDTIFLNTDPFMPGNIFTLKKSIAGMKIPPGVSDSIGIIFHPDQRGSTNTAMMFFPLNNVAAPTVSLNGTGFAPQIFLQDTIITLAPHVVNVPDTESVYIKNIGEDTLHLTSLTILNTKQGDKFSITGSESGNLFSQKSGKFSFIYTPTTEGTDTAILLIHSDDPLTSQKQITIIGTGIKGINSVRSLPLGDGFRMDISPNPSNGLVTVTMNVDKPNQINFELIDDRGVLIRLFPKVTLHEGKNAFSMPLDQSAPGKYFLRAMINGTMIAEKALVVIR